MLFLVEMTINARDDFSFNNNKLEGLEGILYHTHNLIGILLSEYVLWITFSYYHVEFRLNIFKN